MKKVAVQKVSEKEEVKIVTSEELSRLNTLQNKRNMEIAQLGMETYNWQISLQFRQKAIEKLWVDQKVLGEMLLSSHGYDVEKENFSIDLQTGVITSLGSKVSPT